MPAAFWPPVLGLLNEYVGVNALAVARLLISRDRAKILVYHSPPEKPLSKRRYEANFDEQSNNCLYRGQSCYRITQSKRARKEPASMKRGNAEDQCLRWREMSNQIVACSEHRNHQDVNEQAASWLISVACQDIEEP